MFANSISRVIWGINLYYPFFFFWEWLTFWMAHILHFFVYRVILDCILDIVLFCIDVGFSYINSESVDLITFVFLLAQGSWLGAQAACAVPRTDSAPTRVIPRPAAWSLPHTCAAVSPGDLGPVYKQKLGLPFSHWSPLGCPLPFQRVSLRQLCSLALSARMAGVWLV